MEADVGWQSREAGQVCCSFLGLSLFLNAILMSLRGYWQL